MISPSRLVADPGVRSLCKREHVFFDKMTIPGENNLQNGIQRCKQYMAASIGIKSKIVK